MSASPGLRNAIAYCLANGIVSLLTNAGFTRHYLISACFRNFSPWFPTVWLDQVVRITVEKIYK